MLYNINMGRRKKKNNSLEASFAVQGAEGAPATAVYDAAKVEKEFYEIFNHQRKQRNNLLGDFVGDEYKISKEIQEQLIIVPKRFDNFDNNLAYASVKLNNFVLNFKVEFDIDESFCKAKFSIIEMEQGVVEDIKHTTLLDSVIEPYSFTFRDEVFKKWNIFYDGDINQKNDLLQAYLHMQQEEWMFNREITEILSQLYVLRVLQILESFGEEGQKASYEFKIAMEKMLQENPDFANNFSNQKILLDYFILSNKLLPKILETEDGKKILQGYSRPLKNIKDKTYPTVLNDKVQEKAKTEAKKQETKKKVEMGKPKKKSSSTKPLKPFILDLEKVFPKAKAAAKKEEKKKAKPGPVVAKTGGAPKAPAPEPKAPEAPSKVEEPTSSMSDEEAERLLAKAVEETGGTNENNEKIIVDDKPTNTINKEVTEPSPMKNFPAETEKIDVSSPDSPIIDSKVGEKTRELGS